jgi:hypothetical protein
VDDPADLLETGRFTVPNLPCQPDDIIAQTCNATGFRSFNPRPIGGTSVVEGNLEVRFALGREFEFVTFGDFGQVWGPDQTLGLGDLEFTPGVGIRYLSPVGPIRVDVGYSFRGDERLTVVTPQIVPFAGVCDPDERNDCLIVGDGDDAVEIPYTTTGRLAVLPSVSYGQNESRFQLHLSIGQAF